MNALTIREAASRLRATPWEVRQAITAGELPARKVGKRLTVTEDDLERWYVSQPPVRAFCSDFPNSGDSP